MIEQPMPGSTLTRAEIARRVAALEAEREAAATRAVEAPKTRARRSSGIRTGTPRSDRGTVAQLREVGRRTQARKAEAAGDVHPLKAARHAERITQREAARRAHVSLRSISRVECGQPVSGAVLRRISSAFPGLTP